jgi:7,8-dihydropterin-6-yl-methyl-4-(beta-D-ribofuranosyl)aminobenzene 5'-phosphate synthase
MTPPELDQLTITIVVDNATDTLSSITPGIPQLPEMAYLLGGPSIGDHDGVACVVTFDHLCVACHGFSALASARLGDRTSTILFDVGPYADVWLANADRLAVDLAGIDLLFLSHWHWDHTGGVPEVVAAIAAARAARGRPPLIVDVHPDRPDQRGVLTPLGSFAMLPEEPTFAAIEDAGGVIAAGAYGHPIGDALFHASGEVPRITPYETGLAGHHTWRNGAAKADEMIREERFVAARVRGRAVTVLTACSHAGVVNVALEAQKLAPNDGIDLLVGGYHLAGGPVEGRIEETVRDLVEIGPRIVAPGHCTGWRAAAALAGAFPNTFGPSVVGSRYVLTAPLS